jgi:plastocyanin
MTRMLCLVAGILAVVAIAAATDLNGQVLITRQLSRKTVTPVYNLRGTAPPPASIQSDPINEFERTVVFVEGGKPTSLPPQTATMTQRNSRFEPDLLVVPAGSTVQFPNADPIFHNVFSLSKAHPFDLGFYPQSQTRSVAFSHAGVVQVYCHIHASMYAAIVVTEGPWNGKPSSADGAFSFHDVPAGHYRVVAWHKVAGAHWVEVDVPETGSVRVTIGVPVQEERP